MVDVTKIPGINPAGAAGRSQNAPVRENRSEDIENTERAQPEDEVSFSPEAQSLQEAENNAREIREFLQRSEDSLSPAGSLIDFEA